MEEVKSIDNPETKKKYPVGMIILMVYLGYSLIMRIISIGSPILLFGPFLLPHVLVVLYYSISVVIIGFCLWSVFKKKVWGRKLITFWYGFGIIYVLMHSIVSLYYKDEFLDIYKKIFGGLNLQVSNTMLIISGLILPLAFVIIINAFIIWYVNKKKDYFVS